MLAETLSPLSPQVVLEECLVEPPVPDPGEAPAVALPAGAKDASLAAGPSPLRTGDVHTALFTVVGGSPALGASLGTLLLRWRRARWASSPWTLTSDCQTPR